MIGYRVVGRAPDAAQFIAIFAPHTSNWDFPIMILVRMALGRRVSYLGKHTLFRFPFGWFFRWTGGIPVERSESHQLVDSMVRAFAERPALCLGVAPEGTRAYTDHWKSGFYHVALRAGVPVVPAFLDVSRRECGVGEPIRLTGDVERDLDVLRAFYASKRGIRPERASLIRFQR